MNILSVFPQAKWCKNVRNSAWEGGGELGEGVGGSILKAGKGVGGRRTNLYRSKCGGTDRV